MIFCLLLNFLFYPRVTLAETADLVLCPYSYLLDPMIRKSMGIDIAGAIVIIDEAHNVEGAHSYLLMLATRVRFHFYFNVYFFIRY